jgi:hypothetical protein
MIGLFLSDLTVVALAMVLPALGARWGSQDAPAGKRRLPFLTGLAAGMIVVVPVWIYSVTADDPWGVDWGGYGALAFFASGGILLLVGLAVLLNSFVGYLAYFTAVRVARLRKGVRSQARDTAYLPRWQLSVRELLIGFAVVALLCGVWRITRSREIDRIRACDEQRKLWGAYGWVVRLDGSARVKALYLPEDGPPAYALPITDDVLEHLTSLEQLKRLELNGTDITDAGLLKVRQIPHLLQLDLSDTRITDQGLAHLANTPLSRLCLRNTRITDAALPHLKSIDKLRGQKWDQSRIEVHVTLDLRGTQVTPAGIAQMRGSARHWMIEY